MVKVYHGTTIKRAKSIIKDKLIKVTDSDNYRYDDTTKGYVYVTTRLCDALDFSTRPIAEEDTLVFVVFQILIDENELMIDHDEEKWISTLSDGGEKECYRINRNLLFDKDVVSVFCKRMPSHSVLGDYMQAIQYGEQKIKESEWKKLCHA